MKLVYKDPHVSGIQIVGCDSRDKIAKTLAKKGMTEDECSGEIVYYIFIDRDGNHAEGQLDFT